MKSKKIYVILLFLLIAFHCVNNYIWSHNNNAIAGIDSQNHLLYQLQFFDRLSDILKSSSLDMWKKLVASIYLYGRPESGVFSWPQFVYLSSCPFLFFDRSLLAFRLSMLPYFLILIVSTYGIGKRIASKSTGLLAAGIVSFYPMIFESSRQYQLDFPLTALVALIIFLLLGSDGFKSRKSAVLCGLAIGIGMHIKGQLLFFVIPALIPLIIHSLFLDKTNSKSIVIRKLSNLSLLTIISAGISALWWANKLSCVRGQFLEHLGDPIHLYYSLAGLKCYSFPAMFYYLKAIVLDSVGPVFFALFFFSFLSFLKSKLKCKSILILWIAVPFLLFSLVFTVKQSRYIMPILPAMAVASSCGLTQLKKKGMRYLLITLVVLFGFFQSLAISYRFDNYHRTFLGRIAFLATSDYGTAPYYRDFKINGLVKRIRKIIPEPEEVSIAYIPFDQERPGDYEVPYWFKLKDSRLEVINLAERGDIFFNYFHNYRFILFYSNSSSLPEFEKEVFKRRYSRMLTPGKYNGAFPDERTFHQLMAFLSKFEPYCKIKFAHAAYWHLYYPREKKEINDDQCTNNQNGLF